MSQAPIIASGVVRLSHHMFYLAEKFHTGPRDPILPSNGLINPQPGIAVVYTGVSTGVAAITVEARQTAAAQVDTAGWEDVVEVSMEAPDGELMIAALMDAPPDNFPLLTPAGPGTYRVRAHANGRDTDPDGAAFEPVESYLIVVWPAPATPEIVYKQTTRYADEVRRAAAAERNQHR